MKQVPLANGKGAALVDDADFERVSKHGWCRHSCGRYAHAGVRTNGRLQTVLMHRFILEARPDQTVDHRDGDGLNNQRHNLRFATRAQNNQNTGPYARRRQRSSSFKGVTKHKHTRKWLAQIRADKRYYHLGLFATEVEAARAYDAAARKLHGEFAHLNFPETLRA